MPKVTEVNALPVKGWAKGLNRDASALLLAPDESPDSLNIMWGQHGEATRRSGYSVHKAPTGNPAAPVAFRQMMQFSPSDGASANDVFLIGVTLSGAVWALNLTDHGDWAQLKVGSTAVDLGSGTTILSWEKALAQLNGVLVMSSQGLGGMYAWDGDDPTRVATIAGTSASSLDGSGISTRLNGAFASDVSPAAGETFTVDSATGLPVTAFNLRVGQELVRVIASDPRTTTLTIATSGRGYSGTTASAHGDGSVCSYDADACRAKTYAVWADRAWAGYYAQYDATSATTEWKTSNIIASDLINPLSWNITNFIAVNPDDGQFITKLVPFGQSLLIFKNQSLYGLVGSDPTTATLWPLAAVGTTATQSVAVAANKVFFFSPSNGVFAYDGATVQPIDSAIRKYLLAGISDANANRCTGFIRQNQYHLSVPWTATAGSYPRERRFVYDIETSRWEEHTCGIIAAFYWGGATGEAAGWYGAGGQDWLTAASAQFFDNSLSDAGVDFSWNLETCWLPGPDERVGLGQLRLRRLIIHLKGVTAGGGEEAPTMSMKLYTDFNDATAAVTVTGISWSSSAEGLVYEYADFDSLFDSIRVRLESDQQQKFEVAQITLLFSERAPKRAYGG
jgi:hypothetical protein